MHSCRYTCMMQAPGIVLRVGVQRRSFAHNFHTADCGASRVAHFCWFKGTHFWRTVASMVWLYRCSATWGDFQSFLCIEVTPQGCSVKTSMAEDSEAHLGWNLVALTSFYVATGDNRELRNTLRSEEPVPCQLFQDKREWYSQAECPWIFSVGKWLVHAFWNNDGVPLQKSPVGVERWT